jgi:hypothetical protein
MLSAFGGFAEFERELICARTSEGRSRAKARGVHMGRPPPVPAVGEEVLAALAEGSATQADLARRFNVSWSRFRGWRAVMAKDEIEELLEMFQDGSGFGDPDARRNAEQRLQVLLARGQQAAANRLNLLTLLLVIVGLLNVAVIVFQVWRR